MTNSTNENSQNKAYQHSEFSSLALIKGFKELPSGNIAVDLALMSGKAGDKQRYLNGSLIVSSKVSYFAKSQLGVNYGDKGIVAKVVVGDMDVSSVPNDKDPGKPYTNIGGFLNEVAFC